MPLLHTAIDNIASLLIFTRKHCLWCNKLEQRKPFDPRPVLFGGSIHPLLVCAADAKAPALSLFLGQKYIIFRFFFCEIPSC